MALTLLDQVNIPNQQSKIVGLLFETVDEMVAYPENYLPKVWECNVSDSGARWRYQRDNASIVPYTENEAGKWRKIDSGGASGDGKVKIDNLSGFKFLEDWLDKQTVVNDNGVIKAVLLAGMDVTVADINFLQGATGNIQEQINALEKLSSCYGLFNTKAELDESTQIVEPKDNQLALIRADEERAGSQTSYIYITDHWEYWTDYSISIRNFETDPIDLEKEVKGVLPKEKIDTDIARVDDVLDKASYVGTETGVVKRADEIKGISKTDIQSAIDDKHTHANKGAIDNIIENGTGDKFLSDDGTYKEPKATTDIPISQAEGNSLKKKADGYFAGVEIDSVMSDTSENAVKNNVIKAYVDENAHTHDNKDLLDSLISDGEGDKYLNDKGEYAEIIIPDIEPSVDENNAFTMGSDNKPYVKDLQPQIDELRVYEFPKATIVGNPTINHGQISGFSQNDYLRFPFIVGFEGRAFTINTEFTTSTDVTNQQNIFDSDFGFAFAIRNGKFVIAMSSDGATWDMGEHIGTYAVQPETTYKVRLSWDKTTYKVEYSTDGGDSYITDISVNDTKSLYPTQIYIGVGMNHGTVLNHFLGSINFNYCNLYIGNDLVWQGMDDLGRLNVDVSNISPAGVKKIREIAGGGMPELAENGGLEISEDKLKMKSPIEVREVEGSVVDYIPKATTNQYGLVKLDKYSTDEVKTNKVWIDGKPIYRKCLSLTSFGAGQMKVGLTNLDMLCGLRAVVRDTQNMFQVNYYDGTNSSSPYWNGLYYTYATDTLVIRGSSGSVNKAIIIFEYTKTTN